MHVRQRHDSDSRSELSVFAAPYTMLEELGRGGMAQVFRVLDKRSGQVVALKQLLPAQTSELARQRTQHFEHEFQVLSQLSHPRVIEVYDYGQDARGPYYTMELLDGGDLSTQAPVHWRRACELAYDICSSLALLHLRRLVHRDINPRNVRCTSDGHAKLIDFGAMVSMDTTAALVGTPPFIPPEAHQHRQLDARADLFSLGATLYFVLTGELAFPAQRLDQLTTHWRTKPRVPSKLVKNVPPALDRLVMSLISLDPVLRPRSAFEVMQRLKVIAGIARDEPPSVLRAYLATPMLVARDNQLEQFRDQLDASREGRGKAVLIAAEPGLGSTRMLEACALEAKTLGFHVLRASPSAEQAPGLSLVHALTGELHRVTPRATAQSADNTLSTAVAAHQRSDQAAHLTRWVSRVSRQFPLLIIVDDCEQLDDVSLGVLCKLAQRASKQRVILLMASAEDRDKARRTGIELLKAHCELLTLTQLSLAETGQLLSSIFGDVPNLALLSARIHELSSGNPRESLGLAQHLIDRGVIRYEGGCWSLPQQLVAAELPHGMRDVFQLRCSQLSPLARHLAEVQSLALEERFGRSDYTLIAPDPDLAPAHLDAALDELVAAGALNVEDGRNFKLGTTAASVLRDALSESAQRAAYSALAHRSQQRGRHPFVTARFLLRAGELERGVDSVLDIVRTARSREHLFGSSQLGGSETARVLLFALESALGLGRRARDLFDLRHCILLVSVSADDDFYACVAPAFLAQVVQDSGLADYHALADITDAPTRLQMALSKAAKRHAALPEHERVYAPHEAIRLLTHYVGLSIAESSRRYDMQLAASLPALLEPFTTLSPIVAAIRENALAMLEASLYRRPERAAQRWLQVYDALEDMPALEPDLKITIRMAVAYGLGLCQSALGMRAALDWVDVLDQDPLQRVNAMYIRKILRLQHGDLEGAERYRRQAELLALQARSRQMFNNNVTLELSVHSAAWDLTGLQQINARIEPLAARYSGWQPFKELGQGHYLRVLGDLSSAEAAYRRCIALSEPSSEHPLRSILAWPLAVAGLTETLLALDRAEDAYALAAQAYAQSQERQMRATVFEIRRVLGLSEAKLGRHAAGEARLDQLIADQRGLGVSGLNLGASYEARARAAIWAGDTPAVERFAALAAQQYRYGHGSMLGVRYERLMDEAQMHPHKVGKRKPKAPTSSKPI
jgi:serine/threonine protein kinase